MIQAQWSEIDLGHKVWHVPAERMKSKRPHRVPSSLAAVTVLKAFRRRDKTYVFPSHKSISHLSNAAVIMVLKRMQHTDITVHGFRSTSRDWPAESTNYPSHVAEMALAHALRDKTEAAYSRGDPLEKRARLITDWARFCSKQIEPAAVITIRQGAG